MTLYSKQEIGMRVLRQFCMEYLGSTCDETLCSGLLSSGLSVEVISVYLILCSIQSEPWTCREFSGVIEMLRAYIIHVCGNPKYGKLDTLGLLTCIACVEGGLVVELETLLNTVYENKSVGFKLIRAIARGEDVSVYCNLGLSREELENILDTVEPQSRVYLIYQIWTLRLLNKIKREFVE